MKILSFIIFALTFVFPVLTYAQNKAADEETLRKKAIYSVLIFYNIGKMTPQDINAAKNTASFLLLDQFVLENTEYNQIKVNFVRNGESVWKYELQQHGDKITFTMPKLQLPSPEQLVPHGMTFEVTMPERKQPFILTPQDLAPEHAKMSNRNIYSEENASPKDKAKDKEKEKDKELLKTLTQWNDGFSEKKQEPPEQTESAAQDQELFPIRLNAMHPQMLTVGMSQIFMNVLILRRPQSPELTDITVNTFVNGVPGKAFQFSIPAPGQTQGARIPMDTSKISAPGPVTLKIEFVCRASDGKEYRREFSKTVNAASDENQYPKRGFRRSL